MIYVEVVEAYTLNKNHDRVRVVLCQTPSWCGLPCNIVYRACFAVCALLPTLDFMSSCFVPDWEGLA